MKAALLALLSLLAAGCTSWSPEQATAATDNHLCTAFNAQAGGGAVSPVLAAEVKKRGLVRPEMMGAALSRTVVIGMTASEAACAWGPPSEVLNTVTATGESQQWVYRSYLGAGVGSAFRFLYVEAGVVTAVQN